MWTHARGVIAEMGAGDRTEEPRGSAVMREHGALVARLCMALLGDAAAAETALERVAREAGAHKFEDGKDARTTLIGIARAACANQLSKLPIRTAAWGGAEPPKGAAAANARAALGKLKPTEREAVVLHLVGGLDAAQVAEACGTDLATARGRIARGIAQLVQEEKRR
jgi:RNA polymerase sigma-70 factor (ECF subfamily)